MENRIYEYVTLGQNVTVRAGEPEMFFGSDSVIGQFTTIRAGTKTGSGFQPTKCTSISGNYRIGDGVSIGTHTVRGFGDRNGDRLRSHTGCFLNDVEIGEDVFVGPNVTFTGNPHPPEFFDRGYHWKPQGIGAL